MKITKQSFRHVLESGCAVIVFDVALMQEGKTPDVELYSWVSEGIVATIPNQHIKEFEKAFIAAGGVIE